MSTRQSSRDFMAFLLRFMRWRFDLKCGFDHSEMSRRKLPKGMAAVALLPASMDPSIYSDVFARYERGALEIEHRVDDIRNFTHPSQGMKLCQLRMITLSVHRRVNDGRRHRVEPDVARRVFQRQRLTRSRHR